MASMPRKLSSGTSVSIDTSISYLVWLLIPFGSILHVTGMQFASVSVLLSATYGGSIILSNLLAMRMTRVVAGTFLAATGFVIASAAPALWIPIEDGPAYLIGLTTCVLGLFSLIGFWHSWTRFPTFVLRGALHGIVVFSLIAVIEVLFIAAGMIDAKIALNFVLSGESSSRLLSTGFEPSITSRISIFNLGLILSGLLPASQNLKRALALINLTTAALAFSILGFAIPIFFLLIMAAIRPRAFGGYRFILSVSALFIISAIVVATAWDDLANTHAVRRIYRAMDAPFAHWVYLDGSVALRILSQVVAFNVFMEFPMGIGAGQFSSYFASYANGIFLPVQSLPEVSKAFSQLSANPQSLFARLVVEGGVLSALLSLYFLVVSTSRLCAASSMQIFFFSFFIICASQTASFGFANVWAAFAIFWGYKRA